MTCYDDKYYCTLLFVLVYLTLTQSHRSARKQKFQHQSFTKFSDDLDGTWFAVETGWCDELLLSRPFNIKLHSVLPFLMTCMCMQVHRVTGMLKRVQSFICEVA